MANMSVDSVVHDGLVVTSNEAYKASVAIKGEKIVAVGPSDAMPRAVRYIDAAGKYVLPGAIDCHLHFGAVDDWTTGAAAAAHSGLTTMIPFINYSGAGQGTLPEVIAHTIEHTAGQSLVDFGLHIILGSDVTNLAELPEAIGMGATSFKVFMTYKKRGDLMYSDAQIAKVMEIVGKHGGILQVHCENGEVIDYLEDKAMAEGRTLPTDFPATCPTWAEEEAINRAILLGRMTNCPTYVVHLSTRSGLERIKRAQRMGQHVWTETCPQYLLLSEKEMETLGPLAKIGPPLRSADGDNQEALWQGTEHGFISSIGSDHSPAPRESKEPGWQNIFVGPDGEPIPFGAPSLETLVPLVYSEGVAKRGLPLTWMARVLAENPARIFGLYPRKGTIRPGADADLLIIDPGAEHTVRAANHLGNSGFTPYEGWTVHGRPWMTLLRGQVLLHDGRVEQTPGYGEFLPAQGPVPPIAGMVR